MRRVPMLALAGLLVVASGRAQDVAPPRGGRATIIDPGLDRDALEARLRALEGEGANDPALEGTLEQARLALDRAAQLERQDRGGAAARALRIARAALILADRRLARGRAARALELSRHRLEVERSRLERARRARELAQAQLLEMARVREETVP